MKSDSEKLNDLFNLISDEFVKYKTAHPESGSLSSHPVSRLYLQALEIIAK